MNFKKKIFIIICCVCLLGITLFYPLANASTLNYEWQDNTEHYADIFGSSPLTDVEIPDFEIPDISLPLKYKINEGHFVNNTDATTGQPYFIDIYSYIDMSDWSIDVTMQVKSTDEYIGDYESFNIILYYQVAYTDYSAPFTAHNWTMPSHGGDISIIWDLSQRDYNVYPRNYYSNNLIVDELVDGIELNCNFGPRDYSNLSRMWFADFIYTNYENDNEINFSYRFMLGWDPIRYYELFQDMDLLYKTGYTNGYKTGYTNGYITATNQGITSNWFTGLFDGISGFLNIHFGPVSIGQIILIPLSITIVWFIIRQFRGGGGGD